MDFLEPPCQFRGEYRGLLIVEKKVDFADADNEDAKESDDEWRSESSLENRALVCIKVEADDLAWDHQLSHQGRAVTVGCEERCLYGVCHQEEAEEEFADAGVAEP